MTLCHFFYKPTPEFLVINIMSLKLQLMSVNDGYKWLVTP